MIRNTDAARQNTRGDRRHGPKPEVSTRKRAWWKKQQEIERKYYELLYAVESKYEGESRHQTALRYIQLAEHGRVNKASTTRRWAGI